MLQSCYWEEKETSRIPPYEAETIIFYIYAKLPEKGELRTVIIDAEHSDVAVLAARNSRCFG